jgi:hypothetical protein
MEVSHCHSVAIEEIENQFGTHLEKGLTPKEAEERL